MRVDLRGRRKINSVGVDQKKVETCLKGAVDAARTHTGNATSNICARREIGVKRSKIDCFVGGYIKIIEIDNGAVRSFDIKRGGVRTFKGGIAGLNTLA